MTINEFSQIVVSCGFKKGDDYWEYKNYVIFAQLFDKIIIRPFVIYDTMCLQVVGLKEHFVIALDDITEEHLRKLCQEQIELVAFHEKLNKIYKIQDRKKELEKDFGSI